MSRRRSDSGTHVLDRIALAAAIRRADLEQLTRSLPPQCALESTVYCYVAPKTESPKENA